MHIIGRLTTFQSVLIHILKVAGDDLEVIFVTLGYAIKAAHVAVICVQPNNVFSVSGKPESGTLLRHDLALRISLMSIRPGVMNSERQSSGVVQRVFVAQVWGLAKA